MGRRSLPMDTIRVEATVEKDGELHLRNLPYRKGDRVEGILNVESGDAAKAAAREAARRQFLELARASTFRSSGKYPTRDELHERD